jgi:hypothetical protein
MLHESTAAGTRTKILILRGIQMADANRYTMLVTSLPFHGPPFAAKQTPLSRLKLEQRLTMLSETDRDALRLVEELLQWGNLSMDRTDTQIIRQAENALLGLEDDRLREIVILRLEMRTLVAALRRRYRGESAPLWGEPWGYGHCVNHIQRYWTAPSFGLAGSYPWLRDAERLLAEKDSFGLERLLLGVAWELLGRAGEGHYFDFVAVVVYVLRWDIVDRWVTYSRPLAADRFGTLVDEGLGEHGAVFASRGGPS